MACTCGGDSERRQGRGSELKTVPAFLSFNKGGNEWLFRFFILLIVIWSAWFWLAKFEIFTPNAANFWGVLIFWTLGIIPLGILAMVAKPAVMLPQDRRKASSR